MKRYLVANYYYQKILATLSVLVLFSDGKFERFAHHKTNSNKFT